MKQTKFSRRSIVLSSILLVIILCGTSFYLGAASRPDYTGNGVIRTYASTPDSLERKKHAMEKRDKEEELRSILLNFDKKNIVHAWVLLGTLDNGISCASIVLTVYEEISSSEYNDLMLLISENINVDIDYINIEIDLY